MNNIKGVCDALRRDGESINDEYENFGLGVTAKELDRGVAKWVKRRTLRSLGHVDM